MGPESLGPAFNFLLPRGSLYSHFDLPVTAKSDRVFPGHPQLFLTQDTHSMADPNYSWWFEAVTVPEPTCHAKSTCSVTSELPCSGVSIPD